MDSGDEQDGSSSLLYKKIYDDRLPKHDSAKNPEGTQKWLNACDEVVQSMTSSGGDKLIDMQRSKMPEIGTAFKKSIDNAPPWLQADAELNYSSSDDESKEKTKAKGKKAVTDSSESKSSSEELIVEEEIPADGQTLPRGHKSNIQSSALADTGIKLSPAAKKLDKALFHALKRCIIGPVALHFDRVTKCSYVQVTLLMYKDIFHSGPRAKLNTLGNMLDIPWNGNVEEWKSTIMDRHNKLRTVKFNLRELSLFGVLMSSQKVSPSLYSQVGVMVTTMDPDSTFDDDITKICLLAQQYSKESSSTSLSVNSAIPEPRRSYSASKTPNVRSGYIEYPPCGFCGKTNHDRKDCFAENPCSICGKVGHFAKTCRTKKINVASTPTDKPEASEEFSRLMDDESYQKLVSLFSAKNISMVKVDSEYHGNCLRCDAGSHKPCSLSSSFANDFSVENDRGAPFYRVDYSGSPEGSDFYSADFSDPCCSETEDSGGQPYMLDKLMSLVRGKEYCIPYASTLEDNAEKQNKSFPAILSSSQTSPIENYMRTGLEPVYTKVVLSFGDGHGTFARNFQRLNIVPTAYIAVEIDPKAQKAANFANPVTDTFPGINHDVCQDITKFTDDTIKQISEKYGEISFVNVAMLCEDFSMAREMAPRNATDLKRLIANLARPGMMGEKGKLLLLALLHYLRIKYVFPKVKFLFENVIFTDLPDFQVVELVLECVAMLVNSSSVSYSNRPRAFFTNISNVQIRPLEVPPDPNECMDTGRTLTLIKANGRQTSRTIGKSWKGTEENPVANTNSPVLVTDVNYSEPQHLRSGEALRLMGFPSQYNRAEGITEKDSLILTGQSYDSNVSDYFAFYYRLELMAIADVKRYLQDDKEDNVNTEALVGCVQLSLAVLFLFIDVASLTASFLLLTTREREIVASITEEHSVMRKIHFAIHRVPYSDIILDSGASIHLARQVDKNTNVGSPLIAFDGKRTFTTGKGTAEFTYRADMSQALPSFSIKLENVEELPGMAHPLVSMGTLFSLGWTFDFGTTEPGKAYAFPPVYDSKNSSDRPKVPLHLAEDFTIRFGDNVSLGTSKTVNLAINELPKEVSADFMHMLWNHRMSQRLIETIRTTQGIDKVTAEKLVEKLKHGKIDCEACGLGNARRQPICHSLPRRAMMVIPDQGDSFSDQAAQIARLERLHVDQDHINTAQAAHIESLIAQVQHLTDQMKPGKFYAVSRGRETGIFDWPRAQNATIGFSGACFQGFSTYVKAEEFMASHVAVTNETDHLKTEIYRLRDRVDLLQTTVEDQKKCFFQKTIANPEMEVVHQLEVAFTNLKNREDVAPTSSGSDFSGSDFADAWIWMIKYRKKIDIQTSTDPWQSGFLCAITRSTSTVNREFMYLVISHATNQTSDPSLLAYMEYNACQKMYFDKDVVRSLVDMGMNEARAKWASHFLHDQCFAADRHADFFSHVPGMANYIFSKRTGYI